MIHEEIDQILEQAFKNVMRKSKFFQANRKMLRKFLDAIKQEIENSACHEESEEDMKKSYDAFTRMVRKCGIFCPFSRTEHNST